MDPETAAQLFALHRPRLLGVAYAVVGEVAEAEDVVQDAWVRWRTADLTALRSAEAFLVATVTRLGVDRLRSARMRREHYVGTWLPDPLVRPVDGPEELALEAEQVSLALLVALERLNPVERAVLVLRDVFDLDYAEIADALEVSPANARQIAKRARDRVGDAGRRQPVALADQRRLTSAFLRAAGAGDVDGLRAILAADAIQYSDGGGHGNVARKPIHGVERIARFYANAGRAGRIPRDLVAEPILVNGQVGARLVSPTAGRYAITALEHADGQIVAIRNFVNPDRFAHR